MWKPRPEEKPTVPNPPVQSALTPMNTPAPLVTPAKETRAIDPFRAEVAAHIGRSVVVKGELSGSEDLFLDGEVEGTINLNNHKLVVGPNGRIHASVSAREIVIHGKVEGNITGTERVELKKSCVLTGDIRTQRVIIEDGAYFKGMVDLQRESKTEPRQAMAAAASSSASVASVEPANLVLEHT